ncbi:MAG: hypothetical protein ACLU3F_15355 [Blautia wexlerae]
MSMLTTGVVTSPCACMMAVEEQDRAVEDDGDAQNAMIGRGCGDADSGPEYAREQGG